MTLESSNNKSREEILSRIEELNSLIKKEEGVIRKRDIKPEALVSEESNGNLSSPAQIPELEQKETNGTPSQETISIKNIDEAKIETPVQITSLKEEPKTGTKSLDETLNEIEKNARTSIKQSTDTLADKALEGNKEEIDALTLRINQHNSIKDGIAKLTQQKLETSNEDEIAGIEKRIQTLNSLNPYKSEDKEGAPEEKKGGTVNESFDTGEKNLNDTFNPREKSVAEAFEDGTLKKIESQEDIKNNEGILKSLELIALEQARTEYAHKQKAFLDNKRKTQSGINKIRDFFGLGKKVKEEDLPEELRSLKENYDQKKVVYGKSLIASYIEQVEGKVRNGEITEDQKNETLEILMKGDLFDEIIVKERESLLALQAETLPAKEKGILNKALDGYLKLKPWQRTVISSTLITGVIATTGAFASAGVAGAYLGAKVTRGVASVYAGKKIAKLADSLLEKEFNKDANILERNARFGMADFIDFEKALSYAEQSYSKKLNYEQNSNRVRLAMKGAVSLTVGLAASEIIGKGILPNISTPYTPVEKFIPADSIKPIPDTLQTSPPPDAIKIGGNTNIDTPTETTDSTTVKSPTVETLNDSTLAPKDTTLSSVPSQPKIETPDATPLPEPKMPPKLESISVDADKLGAIETFKDLKLKLSASYPDPKFAPANVREILEGDPTSLAIKYGFYNPAQGAESALMQQGEKLGFDTKGNLYFKDVNGTVDYLSESNKFDGKMVDIDQSNPQEPNLKSINPNDSVKGGSSPSTESINPNDEIKSVQPQIERSINPNDEAYNTLSSTKSINPNEEIGFRQNTFYTADKELDAMTPDRPQAPISNTAIPSTKEILSSIDTKGIHALAEQQFNKDIDSMFQKPNFLLGGSTPGTKTEEWARTLRFISEKKVTGKHIFEAMDAQMLQNTEQGEFFTLGEYAKLLKNETGLQPNDGELLKDYLIRAKEYKITHATNDETMDLFNDAKDNKKVTLSEETQQKIRARRVADNDDVYN